MVLQSRLRRIQAVNTGRSKWPDWLCQSSAAPHLHLRTLWKWHVVLSVFFISVILHNLMRTLAYTGEVCCSAEISKYRRRAPEQCMLMYSMIKISCNAFSATFSSEISSYWQPHSKEFDLQAWHVVWRVSTMLTRSWYFARRLLLAVYPAWIRSATAEPVQSSRSARLLFQRTNICAW